MKKQVLIVLSVVILGVALFMLVQLGSEDTLSSIVGSPLSEATPTEENLVLVGQRAPYFDLPGVTGDHVKISDYSKAPLVILFWATWSQEASDQLKILDDYLSHRSSSEPPIGIIAIDSQEERSVTASFIRRGGYRVTTLVDAQGITSEAYGIRNLPTFYFVDSEGIIGESHAGLLNEKAIGEKVEHVLKRDI